MQAEEILIGCFVECQSIKKVGGRRSVEELYRLYFSFHPSRLNVSPSETKIEPDRRLLVSLRIGPEKRQSFRIKMGGGGAEQCV